MSVDIDNSDCRLDVKEVRGDLTREIILRSNQGKEFRIMNHLVTQRVGGIPARSCAKDENRKSIVMVLAGQVDNRVLEPSINGSVIKS